MANEYICSVCGADGTRYRCHEIHGKVGTGFDSSHSYNAVHCTNINDDVTLDSYLENLEKIRNF